MLDPYDLRITSYLPQTGHGAGGMTVGLTTSGIIVHHIPSGLGISCDSERSQHANKEKAIQMLTSLVLAIESEKQYNEPMPTQYYPGKVQMIKDVRQRVGCGLKEAKEAVDLYNDEELAILYLIGKGHNRQHGQPCQMPQGHPTHCGCSQ
ncbi:peptide chain release factor 1 [Pseudomonas phage phiPsa315]|uniref:Peptide chain release factor 1 n=1 Tax=Pseudomonas phage phiPsa315 TaxID=1460363 RepID=A0A7G9V1V7_9CAUD|nr:peptide chain release factor 1 [Pseudomonas phage phiPsa315]QNO00263.1 peptide chain release factor 1 [Pseudomonas phage phiPsa315]